MLTQVEIFQHNQSSDSIILCLVMEADLGSLFLVFVAFTLGNSKSKSCQIEYNEFYIINFEPGELKQV